MLSQPERCCCKPICHVYNRQANVQKADSQQIATFLVFPSVQEPVKVGDANRAVAVYCVDDLRSKPLFDAAAFHDQLQTKEFGGVLISAAALPSTQSLLQDNSRQLPHGTLCIADVQNSGRGQYSILFRRYDPVLCAMLPSSAVMDV